MDKTANLLKKLNYNVPCPVFDTVEYFRMSVYTILFKGNI